MQILLAAATSSEINPVIDWINRERDESVKLLITGIGGTAAAFSLTRALAHGHPQLVLQAGIGGSFDDRYPPGSLALIGEEVIADLGAIELGRFTDIFDMGFADPNEKPFTNRMLKNPDQHKYLFGLPFVRGATVNGISSSPLQTGIIMEKYHPCIESMEGAALHYVCLMENIPFLQLRAVSNFVGDRNKANWNIPEAIHNLNEKLKSIIRQLTNQ